MTFSRSDNKASFERRLLTGVDESGDETIGKSDNARGERLLDSTWPLVTVCHRFFAFFVGEEGEETSFRSDEAGDEFQRSNSIQATLAVEGSSFFVPGNRSS